MTFRLLLWIIQNIQKEEISFSGELPRMEGVLCPEVNGAFYAMVKLPVDDAEKFCRWMLESFSYKGATVMMAPANGFYADPSWEKTK